MLRHFDQDYRETILLEDGSTLVLRAIQSEDKARLQEGIHQLSAHSQYFRFFEAKHELSESELAYLTEVDGVNHYAIVAVSVVGSVETGVGVARFVRFRESPEVAEPAIAVIDAFQGRGIGTMLMKRLYDAARERGILLFDCEFLGENKAIRHLFEASGLSMEVETAADGVVRAILHLSPEESSVPPHHHSLLGFAASRKLQHQLKQRFVLPPLDRKSR